MTKDTAGLAFLNKDGRPVSIKRVPMSTGKRKFKTASADKNALSPFDRFADSNGGCCKSV